MEDHSIPSNKIYTPPNILEDAHFRAQKTIITTKHPTFNKLKIQNVTPKLSKTPNNIHHPNPELNKHNNEIYNEVLTITIKQITKLETKKII